MRPTWGRGARHKREGSGGRTCCSSTPATPSPGSSTFP
eukprot:CAMPEP_0168498092 /NCGR_PEP_ID=MMETSP0228-20121227/73096_1 /TAXON_ID=133427 /ORGANISM="Protoceratium reticulatum, Strain CCCM 535 (=CCMP 1889)" /LENGTH=37 /DNA_ID= /DNA_START= /DNA_END= /DNA_ORIENTATION=